MAMLRTSLATTFLSWDCIEDCTSSTGSFATCSNRTSPIPLFGYVDWFRPCFILISFTITSKRDGLGHKWFCHDRPWWFFLLGELLGRGMGFFYFFLHTKRTTHLTFSQFWYKSSIASISKQVSLMLLRWNRLTMSITDVRRSHKDLRVPKSRASISLSPEATDEQFLSLSHCKISRGISFSALGTSWRGRATSSANSLRQIAGTSARTRSALKIVYLNSPDNRIPSQESCIVFWTIIGQGLC